jgi:hypothetical protein
MLFIGLVVFLFQLISKMSPPELKRVGWTFVRESGVVDVTFQCHEFEEACVFFCICGLKRR